MDLSYMYVLSVRFAVLKVKPAGLRNTHAELSNRTQGRFSNIISLHSGIMA